MDSVAVPVIDRAEKVKLSRVLLYVRPKTSSEGILLKEVEILVDPAPAGAKPLFTRIPPETVLAAPV